MAKSKLIICPYCGGTQPAADACRACGGLFEPLSRQATHNQMGPWFIRDEQRPFQPGCSYETLLKLIHRGQVTKYSILRGPTTRQFWTVARHVPGVAHLLGYCHNCDAQVDPGDHGCHACGVAFGAYLDRNFLGLPEIRPLPWDLDPNEELRQAASSHHMDWNRPIRGGSLSSFATDEELYGKGAFDQSHGDAGGHVTGSSGSAPGHATAASPRRTGPQAVAELADRTSQKRFVQPMDRSASDAQRLARASRRRAQQQKRMRRVIAIVIIVLIVALAILNASKIASLVRREPSALAPAGGRDVPSPATSILQPVSTRA